MVNCGVNRFRCWRLLRRGGRARAYEISSSLAVDTAVAKVRPARCEFSGAFTQQAYILALAGQQWMFCAAANVLGCAWLLRKGGGGWRPLVASAFPAYIALHVIL